ncbi:phospholipase A2 group XV-like [Bolinopsis microptera]|uniref:phospholipase A2 group XV-like n=1 Tax=Bolinopsis microptera TaxID=2820187 RepID=UPI00307AAC67
MFLVFLVTSLLLNPSESLPKSGNDTVTPVILVPGICGSQIDGWYVKDSAPHYYCTKDSGGWTLLWLCIDCMLPPTISCWTDTFRLDISDVSDIKNRAGVQTKVNDFGYTDGIGYLDEHQFVVQFEKLIIGIEKLPGYTRGISIRGAPYDFRYTPNTKVGQEYFIKLRYLVEETYELNGNTPVMLVAHSMGNPYIVNFLTKQDQAWKDKFIDGYVSLAGVFGGASKAIRSIISGETEGMPQIFVDPLTMREFERTSPSVFWLMPSPDLFGDTPLLYADGRNYTAHDYHDLLLESKVPKGDELYDLVKDLPLFVEDIGVDVHCIHGKDQSTPLHFRYGDDSEFPDTQPITVNGDGDGTVNLRSLELCKKFKRLKSYKTVTGFLATHLEILQRKDVIQFIGDLLTKTNSERRGEEDREDDKTLVF